MQQQSDAQLLREYAAHGSEMAFGEIVARHANLVYSAALRQSGSPELAREIAQSVFTDLARKVRTLATHLNADASLAGWLYRGTHYAALNLLRDERRRQAHERLVMENFNPANDAAPDWDRVSPVLDEAMAELNDADREAVLLRYFKNQDFAAVGRALGVSDDAAQKRVSRAVERLREFLAKRGVTVGASGLAVVISTNAVLMAPAGLSAAITATAIAGTTIATTAVAIAAKTIAMTTLQKTLIAAALAAALGTGIYEAHEASALRTQQGAVLKAQKQLQDDLAESLALSQRKDSQLENLRKDLSDLPRLRNEVAQLRRQNDEQKQQLVTAIARALPARPVAASPATEPGKYIGKDQISFAGYTTPEAAVQSTMWAMLTANYETITNSFSSAMLQQVLKNPEQDRALFAETVSQHAAELRGIQILASKVLADDKVEIKMKIDSLSETEKPEFSIHTMVKVGDQWKLAAPDRSYRPEWEQTGTIQKFSP